MPPCAAIISRTICGAAGAGAASSVPDFAVSGAGSFFAQPTVIAIAIVADARVESDLIGLSSVVVEERRETLYERVLYGSEYTASRRGPARLARARAPFPPRPAGSLIGSDEDPGFRTRALLRALGIR